MPNRIRYDDDDDVRLDDDELHDDSDLEDGNPAAAKDSAESAKHEKARRMLDGLARRIRSLR